MKYLSKIAECGDMGSFVFPQDNYVSGGIYPHKYRQEKVGGNSTLVLIITTRSEMPGLIQGLG